MLRALSIHHFRGLGDFAMDGLGRVNLLVGSNNSGKTSVLEAIHLLLRAGDPSVLWATLARRGEELQSPADSSSGRVMDVSHLFEGHEIEEGSSFRVAGQNDTQSLTLDAWIEPVHPREILLALTLQWANGKGLRAPLTGNVGLDVEAWPRTKIDKDSARPVDFIPTGALSELDTVLRLEDVILTENEELLIRALRSIDDRIERIAPIGRARNPEGGRGGVAVKLKGAKNRIPLGSMGDGMWRMLGIALALVRAKGGALLVDEIDTGLHYSVMESMWRLVYEAAKRLDVQVFAATHSRDCYQSLAAIVQADATSRPEITIQRIERGNPRAVAFTDDEIRVAAEIGAEVR